jgi:hypothetical protein
MEPGITSLVVALAALILLAVTSMRYGADSRQGFASKERELAARGMIWDGLIPMRGTRGPSSPRTTPSPVQAGECLLTPCGA